MLCLIIDLHCLIIDLHIVSIWLRHRKVAPLILCSIIDLLMVSILISAQQLYANTYLMNNLCSINRYLLWIINRRWLFKQSIVICALFLLTNKRVNVPTCYNLSLWTERFLQTPTNIRLIKYWTSTICCSLFLIIWTIDIEHDKLQN